MISLEPISAAVPVPLRLPVLDEEPEAAAVETPSWISLEELLVDLCRERGAALAGCETVVDCEPSGLQALDAEERKLRRCIALLLDTALTTPDPMELDLSVRPAGTEEAPLLVVSLRVVPRSADAPRIVPSRDPEELALLQLFVERSGGTLLMSQVDEGVRRLTLGLEVHWLVARASGRLPGAPPRGRVLLADDCPMVRRTGRRLLERLGFEVAEAPGTLALLAHLDPDELAGRLPDWVLVDEAWVRARTDGTRSLRGIIESTLPCDRVVVLEAVDREGAAPSSSPFRRLVKPLSNRALQALLAEEPAAPGSRNAAG